MWTFTLGQQGCTEYPTWYEQVHYCSNYPLSTWSLIFFPLLRCSSNHPYSVAGPSYQPRKRNKSYLISSTLSSSADRPVVYSDGCCFNNGRPNAQAGIGVYWGDNSPHNVCEQLEGKQTNQRAEVVSACRALESAISQGMTEVEVRTDSSYTIKGMRLRCVVYITDQNQRRLRHITCTYVPITWSVTCFSFKADSSDNHLPQSMVGKEPYTLVAVILGSLQT